MVYHIMYITEGTCVKILCTFILYGMCSVTVPSSCDKEGSLFSPNNTSGKAP